MRAPASSGESGASPAGNNSHASIKEGWLLGASADDRTMMIERNVGDGLPPVLALDQADLFVGASDAPAPRVVHHYARDQDIDGLSIYLYVGAHRGGRPL